MFQSTTAESIGHSGENRAPVSRIFAEIRTQRVLPLKAHHIHTEIRFIKKGTWSEDATEAEIAHAHRVLSLLVAVAS